LDFLGILRSRTKRAVSGIGSIDQSHGFADTDQYKKARIHNSAEQDNKTKITVPGTLLVIRTIPASQLNRLLLLEEHESESILERQTFHLA
jgi:hypothetical protein